MPERRLEVFQTVVSCGSFTGAARQLGMTQPAISFHIRSLEEELGVLLIERTKRRLKLTAAGQVVLDHATRINELYALMQDEVTRIRLG